MVRFCAIFATLALGFALFSSTQFAEKHVHPPLCRLVTRTAALMMSPVGGTTAGDTTLFFRGFRVEVVEACNGLLPAFIYVAAILAFPSRWSAKAWGIALGVPAIFILNLARVVTLSLFGAWRPDLFEEVHIYVWQSLVIALSMAIWIFWAERFVRATPGDRAQVHP